MVNTKVLYLIKKFLDQQEEEDNRNLLIITFLPLAVIALLMLITVYILITPLSVFAQIFYPEETQILKNFQAEYDYILQDLKEFNYAGNSSGNSNNTSEPIVMDSAEAEALLAELNVPADKYLLLSNALSLVGKVDYFWGGKSPAGWNDAWGELRTVTAPGSKNTGKLMPYGLDCSGFVDWAFKTSGYGNLLSGGTAYQWGQCYEIKAEMLTAGDLAFKNPPDKQGVNHVGIYLGQNASGANLYVHCAGGQGVVIDSWSGFQYFRRPIL